MRADCFFCVLFGILNQNFVIFLPECEYIYEYRKIFQNDCVTIENRNKLEYNAKKMGDGITLKKVALFLVIAMFVALVPSMGFRDDDDTYVNTSACADLFVYKKDGDKFLKKKLRERELKEIGTVEHPEETIKWELSKLVNTMEGRPIIGA